MPDTIKKTPRPFGLWTSPVTPKGLAEDRRLEAACWDSDGRTLVWLEGRSGRGALVAQGIEGDAPRELTPELDVRAEVGYGGGDFTVHGGFAYFVVHKTGRIWRQPLAGGAAQPVTPPFGNAASPVVSPDGRWVVYVHHDDEDADRLAVVDADGRCWPQVLVEGHDFFMQPRISADGRRLAWIAWDHPNMPWDGTQLFVATLEVSPDGLPRLGSVQVVAGGPEIAVFQPEFTPDGRTLLFVSDETGWGRIAALDIESGRRRWLTEDGVEYAAPAWVQGMRQYAVSADGRTVTAAASRRGVQSLERIDLSVSEIPTHVRQSSVSETPTHVGESLRDSCGPLAEYSDISQVVASPDGDRVVFVGSGPTTPPRIVACDFTTGLVRVVVRASAELVPPAALAHCEPISWPSTDGEPAHGLYFAPASDRSTGIGKPPLIVMIHGGPTAQAKAGYNSQAQFFATRGYAVLLVNYRGSTGYGRHYMLRLRGNWGVCDVDDALTGKEHLVETGRVDPARTVIMGGSAGGFTVLQTMTGHPQAFAAGVCLYGVADQFHLAAETHKFEAHYLDSLLGPLPQSAAVYRERSPLGFAARIRRPLAVFQGSDDHVVPRAQSDMIVEALKRNGVPHVYHVYEGEGHGWRKRETIEHFYTAVDAFLRQYVIFA
jgi:dipeptidyl aminopeptidase/acylaminoacyl peptidase